MKGGKCQDSSQHVTRERHSPVFFRSGPSDGTTLETGSFDIATESKLKSLQFGEDVRAAEREVYKRRVRKWKTYAREKENENIRLKQQLQEAESKHRLEVKALHDQKDAMEAKLNESQAVIQKKQQKILRLKRQCDSLCEENSEMKDVMREMESLMDKLKKALVKSQTRCEKLKDQRKSLSEQLTKQIKTNEELKRKILDLEEDLTDFQKTKGELREKSKIIEHGKTQQADVAAVLECEPDAFDQKWTHMGEKLREVKNSAMKTQSIKDELEVAVEQLRTPLKRTPAQTPTESQFVRLLSNQLTTARDEIEQLNSELTKRQEIKKYYRMLVENYHQLSRQVADLFQSLVSSTPASNFRPVILCIAFAVRMRQGMTGPRTVNERALSLFTGRIQMSPAFQMKEIRHKFTELTQDLVLEKQKLNDLIDVQIRRDELAKEVSEKEQTQIAEKAGEKYKDRIVELQRELSQCVSQDDHSQVLRMNEELARDKQMLANQVIQLQADLAGNKVLIDSLSQQVDLSKHEIRKLKNRMARQKEMSLLDSMDISRV